MKLSKFDFMNFDLCIIYSKFNACSNDNLFKRINSQYITFITYPLNYWQLASKILE